MIGTFIDIRLEGNKFSPKKLKELTDLPVETIAEYGETAQKGRYKGKPFPYGMALIKVDGTNKEDFNKILGKYLGRLSKSDKKALKKSGVEDIIIDIETSPDKRTQFSFEQKIIKEISRLNARIDFQTIEEENEFEWPIFMQYMNKAIHHNQQNRILTVNQARKVESLLKKENDGFETYIIELGDTTHHPMEPYMLSMMYIIKYIDKADKDIPSFESFTKKVTT